MFCCCQDNGPERGTILFFLEVFTRQNALKPFGRIRFSILWKFVPNAPAGSRNPERARRSGTPELQTALKIREAEWRQADSFLSFSTAASAWVWNGQQPLSSNRIRVRPERVATGDGRLAFPSILSGNPPSSCCWPRSIASQLSALRASELRFLLPCSSSSWMWRDGETSEYLHHLPLPPSWRARSGWSSGSVWDLWCCRLGSLPQRHTTGPHTCRLSSSVTQSDTVTIVTRKIKTRGALIYRPADFLNFVRSVIINTSMWSRSNPLQQRTENPPPSCSGGLTFSPAHQAVSVRLTTLLPTQLLTGYIRQHFRQKYLLSKLIFLKIIISDRPENCNRCIPNNP